MLAVGVISTMEVNGAAAQIVEQKVGAEEVLTGVPEFYAGK